MSMACSGTGAGLKLAQEFFAEAVEPLVTRWSDATRGAANPLPYSAGLLGPGSEILGFDDDVSTDHDFGPRVMVFLTPHDHTACATEINAMLSRDLPRSFRGFSTHFGDPDPNDCGTRQLVTVDTASTLLISHRVECYSWESFTLSYVGVALSDQTADEEGGPSAAVWMTTPQQIWRSLAGGGALFRDDLDIRRHIARLRWPPRDIELAWAAALWRRIAEEEHLLGRATMRNDFLGGSLIASRISASVMRLAFLLERQYAPYPKWFGTAFSQLQLATALQPLLEAVARAPSAVERRDAVTVLLVRVVGAYTDAGRFSTQSVERWIAEGGAATAPTAAVGSKPFFTRPFNVVVSNRDMSEDLVRQIGDPSILTMIQSQDGAGPIDCITDSTAVVESLAWRRSLRDFANECASSNPPKGIASLSPS